MQENEKVIWKNRKKTNESGIKVLMDNIKYDTHA